MVPGLRADQPLPVAPDGDGYVDTGFTCRPGQADRTLIITGPPSDMIDVGGYRFRLAQIDALVSRADPGATIVALPDGDLGHRPERRPIAGLCEPI